MRKVIVNAIGGLIFSAALVNTAAADAKYQQWLDEVYPADGPGATAIVVKDDEVVFRGAAGMANLELNVPMSADNVLRLASISKQFSAAAILLLAEQGRLKVTDDLNKYLPDYPTHGHTITIEHLLTHTSGIFNYTDIQGRTEEGEFRRDVSTQELIEVFANLPMNFAPGDRYSYSNSGYILLGAIIEVVSGQTYAEFMQFAIFDPLGLEHTYHGGLQIIPNRASGYQGGPGQYSNADFISMTQPQAAGALLSTVDDMAKWSSALFGGDLLSEESLTRMITDYELNNGEHAGYGYGLAIGDRFGEHEISHAGGINGFATNGIWLPGQKIYVAILSNNSENRAINLISAKMAFDTAGADYPDLAEIELDPEKIPDYLGVYKINDRETRTVLVEDGRLFTQRTGGGRSEIVAHAEDAFFYPNSFTNLKFDRDSSGRVIAMDMYQSGALEAEHAERISDTVDAEPDGDHD